MRILAGAAAVLVCALAATAATPAPRITLVSVALGGKWANGSSWGARVSGDGRFVVFSSGASNLTRARRGGLFVRDLRRRRTVRLGSGGVDLAVTPDARFVVVCTTAPLARGDADAPYGRPPEVERFLDAYVYDRRTGRILRATVPARGRNPNDRACGGEFAGHVDVSADGRYVLFPAKAANIVRGDTNGRVDVFVRDLQARRTRRVSVTSSGAQANGESAALAISADGRLAFFCSGARNLGREPGVFVHDLRTRTTSAVSTAADGRPLSPVICLHGKAASGDGRFVAFATQDPGVTRSGDYRLVVKDRRTGGLDPLTPGIDGAGVGGVRAGAMSASGRYLTFATSASNVVPGDTNRVEDVFWFDRARRATVRLSLRWDGSESFTQFGSDWPAISAEGRWVTWQTADSSFLPGEPRRPIGEETQDIFIRGPLR
jgi:hypothetical protein